MSNSDLTWHPTEWHTKIHVHVRSIKNTYQRRGLGTMLDPGKVRNHNRKHKVWIHNSWQLWDAHNPLLRPHGCPPRWREMLQLEHPSCPSAHLHAPAVFTYMWGKATCAGEGAESSYANSWARCLTTVSLFHSWVLHLNANVLWNPGP